MPPNSPSYRMADRLSEGRIAGILLVARDEGKSFQVIARELFTDFGIEVTDQTVNNWVSRLESEQKAKAS